MIRQVITIDEDRCDGCGLCVNACDEGALAIVNGKARLVREDHCDGLGSCLCCSQDAISFETRESKPFVGSVPANDHIPMCQAPMINGVVDKGVLKQWPIKIDLVPVKAQFFDGSELVVAADCTAFAHPRFHEILKRNVVVIGCPKLDGRDHTQKLTDIIRSNDIKRLTVVRMEVPCCGALDRISREALLDSGRTIPIETIMVHRDGSVL